MSRVVTGFGGRFTCQACLGEAGGRRPYNERVAEDVVGLAQLIRENAAGIVGESRAAAVAASLDRMIADGVALTATFEQFLTAEPDINDWLNNQLTSSSDLFRSFKDLPGDMRFVPSGILVRCPDGHTWELPDAASRAPSCPEPGCGKPLSHL